MAPAGHAALNFARAKLAFATNETARCPSPSATGVEKEMLELFATETSSDTINKFPAKSSDPFPPLAEMRDVVGHTSRRCSKAV